MTKLTTAERRARAEESAEYLRKLLRVPARDLYTVTTGHSDHGSTHRVLITKGGEIYEITSAVARVLGNRESSKGMSFRGKGVSPAHQIASSLTYALWGKVSIGAELQGRAL